jgi:hypothetical protein
MASTRSVAFFWNCRSIVYIDSAPCLEMPRIAVSCEAKLICPQSPYAPALNAFARVKPVDRPFPLTPPWSFQTGRLRHDSASCRTRVHRTLLVVADGPKGDVLATSTIGSCIYSHEGLFPPVLASCFEKKSAGDLFLPRRRFALGAVASGSIPPTTSRQVRERRHPAQLALDDQRSRASGLPL